MTTTATSLSHRLSQALPSLSIDPLSMPMTEEQQYLFDLNGWVLIPSVLTEAQIDILKRQIVDHHEASQAKEQAFYPHQLSGPMGELLEHPVVTGILREILQAPDRTPDCYDFRCDGAFYQYRFAPDDGIPAHGGGPAVGPMFAYQCKNQQIYSGLTRVVWELTEVKYGQGGTLFLSGSHKANFPTPPKLRDKNCGHFSTYSCPPGSVAIFTESLSHAGGLWTNTDNPRMAIFNAYTRNETQYHKWTIDRAIVAAMPKKRQTLFRGAWTHDFTLARPNNYYSAENHAQ